jgi:hypothetical protein
LLFGSLFCNNALLSIFFVQLDSAGEESSVSSQVEVHNGFVESKAWFEFFAFLSALSAFMDMSVMGYNREGVLAVIRIGHWKVSEVMPPFILRIVECESYWRQHVYNIRKMLILPLLDV